MIKRRSFAVILALIILVNTAMMTTVSAGNEITVSLHIAGIEYSLYYDDFMTIDTNRFGWTVISAIKAAQWDDDWLEPAYRETGNGAHVIEINGIREGKYGETSRWYYRVNGKDSKLGMDEYLIQDGDEIVIYFADFEGAGMQISEFKMTEGASGTAYDYYVTFTDSNNNTGTNNRIVGAEVTWDGKKYRTDTDGRIYIPGSAGVSGYHSVIIERYDALTGIPTVLSLPPAYRVFIPYVDLSDDAWYAKAVNEILYNGYMRGVGENRFEPERPMTMAELLVVLWRIAGESYTLPPDAVWYSKALEWATDNGIMFDERYSIHTNVTREMFIYMFYKTIMYFRPEITSSRADITSAADYVNVAADFREAVSWAVAMGIIKGTSGSSLVIDPDSEINRATVCQMVYNYIDYNIRAAGGPW